MYMNPQKLKEVETEIRNKYMLFTYKLKDNIEDNFEVTVEKVDLSLGLQEQFYISIFIVFKQIDRPLQNKIVDYLEDMFKQDKGQHIEISDSYFPGNIDIEIRSDKFNKTIRKKVIDN